MFLRFYEFRAPGKQCVDYWRCVCLFSFCFFSLRGFCQGAWHLWLRLGLAPFLVSALSPGLRRTMSFNLVMCIPSAYPKMWSELLGFKKKSLLKQMKDDYYSYWRRPSNMGVLMQKVHSSLFTYPQTAPCVGKFRCFYFCSYLPASHSSGGASPKFAFNQIKTR